VVDLFLSLNLLKAKSSSIGKALNLSDHLSRPGLLLLCQHYGIYGALHGEYYEIQEDENRDKFPESFGINHPGRHKPLPYFCDHCAAATPPSKGGET